MSGIVNTDDSWLATHACKIEWNHKITPSARVSAAWTCEQSTKNPDFQGFDPSMSNDPQNRVFPHLGISRHIYCHSTIFIVYSFDRQSILAQRVVRWRLKKIKSACKVVNRMNCRHLATLDWATSLAVATTRSKKRVLRKLAAKRIGTGYRVKLPCLNLGRQLSYHKVFSAVFRNIWQSLRFSSPRGNPGERPIQASRAVHSIHDGPRSDVSRTFVPWATAADIRGFLRITTPCAPPHWIPI